MSTTPGTDQRDSCLDENALQWFADLARLPPATLRFVDARMTRTLDHVQGCAECAEALEARLAKGLLESDEAVSAGDRRDAVSQIISDGLRRELVVQLGLDRTKPPGVGEPARLKSLDTIRGV